MELAYHCTLYLDIEDDESLDDVIARLERILDASGLSYNCYDAEIRDK